MPDVKILSNCIYKDVVNKRTDNLLPFGIEHQTQECAKGIVRQMQDRARKKFIENYWKSGLDKLRLDHTEKKYPASIKGFPTTGNSKTLTKDELYSLAIGFVKTGDKVTLHPGTKSYFKALRFIMRKLDSGSYSILDERLYKHTDLARSRPYGFFPFIMRDFTIPGFGEPGPSCCAIDNERISEFSEDFKKVKVNRVICRRVGCPDCYRLWIKERAFQITLALEVTSYLRKERPYGVVFSIPPNKIHRECWNWPQVNRRLFVRSYRRGKACDIKGGFTFFHPFRIRKAVKKRLREYRKTKHGKDRLMYKGDAGFWRMIRKDVLHYGDLYRYVKVGPHLHGVCFGNPKKHTGNDFILKVDYDKKNRKIRKLKATQDVVGKVMYLLTHCGITTNNLIIQPTRRYGCMYDSRVILDEASKNISFILAKPLLDPSEHWWFEEVWLPEKCKEIAYLIDMAWNDKDGLKLREDGDLDDNTVWLPIWNLRYMREILECDMGIDAEISDFFFMLLDYIEKYGRPPPVKIVYLAESTPFYWATGYQTGIEIPDFIEVVRETIGKEPEEIINAIRPDQEYETIAGVIEEKNLTGPQVEFWKMLNSPDPAIRLKALEIQKRHKKKPPIHESI